MVAEAHHQRTARGGAVIQSRLKRLSDNKYFEYRWISDEKFTEIELDQIPMEFLYQDGDSFWFMNQETFDQIMIHRDIVAEAAQFMIPNIVVRVFLHEGNPLYITLPVTVTLAITETGPNVKGGTASGGSTKPATLETGLVVQVPLFVETGEKIIVNTADGTYESRAKE